MKARSAASRRNDQTQHMARPMVVVAAIRSGGTFLTHCLSNHPLIFCDRGEPLHHTSTWVKTLKPDRLLMLASLFDQTGYVVSGCKLTYTQALHREIWPWLVERQPLVLWLTRENLIRQAVSVLLNRQARAGKIKRPQHTFKATRPVRVELDPGRILQQARGLAAIDERARKMLSGRMEKVLPLTYAQIIGGEGQAAQWMNPRTTTAVCQFLGVRRERMGCDLQRVNPYPLRDLLSNWPQVRAAVKGSEFAGCVADEETWDDAG